ncbi:MAG: Rieske 2Fe-2S domain-containing protein [Steroidobacteraceae bacterium]|jgi:phenylpropionate dioxygenase-like ring-hydroxylating dioxygenase large terminal subunit|nr:Rieske 2Fe-2S domain-containing protein [Steroidobacteraceae bacterium]
MEASTATPIRRDDVLEVPPEGEGGFTQSWFPVCYSQDLAPGKVIGREFLGGRIVVMRDAAGRAQALSAYCAHLGVDLVHGEVRDGALRCPFHHWEYGADGRCLRTGIGDPPPPRARLFAFPTAERYGVVFAFNGEQAGWSLPDLHIGVDEAVAYPVPVARIHCDPWKMMANTPDWQHFILLHGFRFDVESARASMEWNPNGFRYTMRTRVDDRDFTFTPTLTGTSVFFVHGWYGERRFALVAPFGLPRPGECDVYTSVVLPRDDPDPPGILGMLQQRFGRMIDEDYPLIDTAHFRARNLTRADDHLARWIRFVRDYPRAHPSRDAIR